MSKTFFITGGTSGIGKATAQLAVAQGHRVYITGLEPDLLHAFVESFDPAARERIGGDIVDAGSWEETQRAVHACVTQFGGLDVVLANAGFSSRGDLVNGDPQSWRNMVMTNVLGPVLLIKATMPHLMESRGHFLFTGSISARKVHAGNLYTATKWAITGLAESLRQQVVGTGVRVGVISPGQVDTPLWAEKQKHMMSPDDVARTIMWMLAQPEHIDVSEIIMRTLGQEF
jgi:NADP-dependent 3-hydroxy acid dehydrogenase YdfG